MPIPSMLKISNLEKDKLAESTDLPAISSTHALCTLGGTQWTKEFKPGLHIAAVGGWEGGEKILKIYFSIHC